MKTEYKKTIPAIAGIVFYLLEASFKADAS